MPGEAATSGQERLEIENVPAARALSIRRLPAQKRGIDGGKRDAPVLSPPGVFYYDGRNARRCRGRTGIDGAGFAVN